MFSFQALKTGLRVQRCGKFGKSAAVRITTAMVAGLLAGAALAASPYIISQKDRAFKPGEITIKRGDTIRFVNDDGDLLHHAYLTSDTFSFDSGDQEPGSKFDVAFTVAGNFTVSCGIHPKMKLLVHVTD